MPKITIIEHNGKAHVIDAAPGQSLMQAAVSNGISGILADCGGSCSCATCHVYVDPAWSERLPPASSAEKEMIECALAPEETSRLSCQIELEEGLDGLVVRLPESQV